MLDLESGVWNTIANPPFLTEASLSKVEVRTASHLHQRRVPCFISSPWFFKLS